MIRGTQTKGSASPVLIEEMTWREVADALTSGKTTVIVACGASEQHGPHLPIGTDTFLGTAIAERAASIAGNALVAPTLRPGLSDHHISFPGTLTLRPQTFLDLLTDYCGSLAKHGFTRIVVFPSHGGNADVMKAHVPWLARRLAGHAELVYSMGAVEQIQKAAEWLAGRGVSIGRAGAHAGFSETSMMLAYWPELVHMEAAEPGLADDELYAPDRVRRTQLESFLHGIQAQSPNGILGDPTGSSADVGETLLQMAAEAVAQDVKAPAVSRDMVPILDEEG